MRALLPLLLVFATPAAAQEGSPLPPGETGFPQQTESDELAPFTAAAPVPMPQEPPRYLDTRLRDIPYDPDTVVQLAVAPARQMTVIFGSGERIQSVAVGDSSAWQVTASRAGDSLFVKPTTAFGMTNMTVITDVRTYLFDLIPGGPGDSVYLARFYYPEAVPTYSGEQSQDELRPATYQVRGARELRPDAIEDDGRKTYIMWGKQKVMPAVFAEGPAGDEMLVNGYVRDGVYTIDRIFPKLIFRIDRKTATAVRR